MALPVILVDSATGSDTQASGAGPSTALFGTTNASTDGTGLIVTLPAGTVLTGVAVDGSHVIFLIDTTAGARNFGKITGSAGSGGATPTVTVSNAFGLSLASKSWAIGGKRASIGETNSRKLFNNNSANGDAMPGWIIDLAANHAETLSASLAWYRGGDTTDGPIQLRCSSSASPAVLTFSNDGTAFQSRNVGHVFNQFNVLNSAAGKTTSIAFDTILSSQSDIRNVRIGNSTNFFRRGIVANNDSLGVMIYNCEIAFCSNNAVDMNGSGLTCRMYGNWIHDTTGIGVRVQNNITALYMIGNIVEGGASDGIKVENTSNNAVVFLMSNTVNGNTGDGFESTAGSASNRLSGTQIVNNIFSNNGGYGANFSGLATQTEITGLYLRSFFYNATFNNSLGSVFPTPSNAMWLNGVTTDPQYTNTAGDDFSVGSNMASVGFPASVIGLVSATRSYMDIGAAQRNPTSSGSGASAYAYIG